MTGMRDVTFAVFFVFIILIIAVVSVSKYGWRAAGINELRHLQERVDVIENRLDVVEFKMKAVVKEICDMADGDAKGQG